MQIIFFIAIIINLLLSLVSLIYSKRNHASWYFSASSFFLSLWVISIFLGWNFAYPLFWARSAFSSSALFIGFCLLFILNYPHINKKLPRSILVVLMLPAIFFALLSYTSFIVLSITQDFTTIYHAGKTFFLIYSLSYTSAGFIILFLKIKSLKGLEKIRTQYFFYGLLVLTLCSITSNLLLPGLGKNEFNKLLPFFALAFNGICLYSIFKHRFLDIEIVLKKSVFYTLLISSTSILLSILLLLFSRFFESKLGLSNLFSTIMISCLLIFILPWLHHIIDLYTDRFFFRRSYSFQETVRLFSNQLRELLDIDEISFLIINTIQNTVKVKNLRLYFKADDHRYILTLNDGTAPLSEVIDRDHFLIQYLSENSNAIILEELGLKLKEPHLSAEEKQHTQQLISMLKQLEICACFPIQNNKNLIGFIVAGQKLSEEAYNRNDISLLETISHQASTAIQNSLHYKNLQENLKTMSLLNDYMVDVNGSFSLETSFELTCQILHNRFQLAHILILLSDENQKTFTPQFGYGQFLLTDYQDFTLSLNEDLLKRPELRSYEHPKLDPTYKWSCAKAHALMEKVSSQFPDYEIYFLPFIKGKKIIGAAVGLISKNEQPLHNTQLLSAICQEATVAIDNMALYQKVLYMKIYDEAVLNNVVCGVITLDSQLNIKSFNQFSEQLTGLTAEMMIGQSVNILCELSELFELFEISFKTQTKQEKEGILNINNQQIPLLISTSVFEIESTNEIGVIGVISDLTTIYRLRRHIEQSERLKSLGTMAAGIAHEIKNPLVPIKAFAQMLPKYWDDTNFREKFSNLVHPQIERINDLCQALLRLGKPQKPELKPVNITDIMKEVMILLEVERKRCKATVAREFEDDFSIIADRNQMTQVILNLALNAMDAMTETGGVLTLKTYKHEENQAVVEITDTGCGMDEETQEKLFDPFYTTKSAGNGLGLSIVLQIITEHKGRIAVKSQIGSGTSFKLFLPLSEQYLDNEKLLNSARILK